MENYYIQALKNALGNMAPQVVGDEYNGNPWSMKWKGLRMGDNGISAGTYGIPSDRSYFANAYANLGDRKILPDFEKVVDSPLGRLSLMSNQDGYNSLSADFNPSDKTQSYVQALKNLLGR